MSTVRQVSIRAGRFLNLVNEGKPTLNAYEFQNLLEAFQAMFTAWVAEGVFGPLTNVAVEADYTANENERIAVITDADVDITLPDTILVSSTDAEPTTESLYRAPYDRSVVILVGGSTYIYDANQGEWCEIEALTLDSYAPLSLALERGLAALLAANMAPEYRMELDKVTTSLAQTTHAALRRKAPILVTVANPLLRSIGRVGSSIL